MKTRFGSRYFRSSPSNVSFSTYLKPGDLAKLRDSRITARSRELAKQAVLALIQLNQGLNPAPSSPVVPMEVVPCFQLRSVKCRPLCIKRKKLVAVTPLFYDTQLQ